MGNKRYVFVKKYDSPNGNGSIPEGSELTIISGVIYYNGSFIEPSLQNYFKSLISNKSFSEEYLKEDYRNGSK